MKCSHEVSELALMLYWCLMNFFGFDIYGIFFIHSHKAYSTLNYHKRDRNGCQFSFYQLRRPNFLMFVKLADLQCEVGSLASCQRKVSSLAS